jgi:segregation and condensation protein B
VDEAAAPAMPVNAERALEAVLFAADAPATVAELAQAVDVPPYVVEEALERLGGRLHHQSGLQLVRIAGGYQLCTKPEYASRVARLLKPRRNRLTRSQLEVLAIVAYQQPVTLAEIEDVRGVDSSHTVRLLADRRLIGEVGRKQAPGRPVLWGTTQHFLHQFNLEDLSALPPVQAGMAATVGASRPPDQAALL